MTSPLEVELDRRLRQAAMEWLDRRCTPDRPTVTRAELMGFRFDGRRVPLVDRGRGIRKPEGFSAALSIMTTFPKPGRPRPYDDIPGEDGLLRYKYQGDNPQQYDNVALREAQHRQVPLIWFYGVAQGVYLPMYPIFIRAEEPQFKQFVVALCDAQLGVPIGSVASLPQRRYSERITRSRLHQPVFRAQVIRAYETACAMCRLRHASLLDAAHILADRHPEGVPAISNGLALCKIHHAAYDQNILGVRPDMVIQVRTDVLEEIDGPMLRHGLQDMHGVPLVLPRRTADRPDPAAVEERYETFRATA